MLHWKDFCAWVCVEGQEALEYGVETSEDQQTVTCWIASELGKTFSVHWTNTSYFHATAGYLKMDGHDCGGKFIIGRTRPSSAEMRAVTDGLTVRHFNFSPVELTGEIFKFQLLALFGKAVTQQISLGKAEKLAKPVTFAPTKRTGPDIVKFRFKYRPLDVLQANGIAPLPPRLERMTSVDPPRALTPHEDLADAEEEKALRHQHQEKLRALEAKRIKKERKPHAKREIQDGDIIDLTQPSKKMKREAKQPFVSGEVIDLT
ncbi:hypothetical protein B0H15DRAFT_799705 [Mycena belliarum]|uniref:DUF7918 domain-containing protein n=1 Tax=Mycena belliarum TaxID=1033014 RepID=A0AAD6U912_9AGAR|nr:hypothetical protein B0H15DRAFT_799705 [Mycena belliae]